jgi:hypothetical protein
VKDTGKGSGIKKKKTQSPSCFDSPITKEYLRKSALEQMKKQESLEIKKPLEVFNIKQGIKLDEQSTRDKDIMMSPF